MTLPFDVPSGLREMHLPSKAVFAEPTGFLPHVGHVRLQRRESNNFVAREHRFC